MPSPGDRRPEDLVREIVARHAPQELPYFDRVRRVPVRSGGPGPLADGLGITALIVTPVLLAVVQDLIGGGVRAGLRALWRRIRRRADPPTGMGPLTAEQVRYARATAERELLAAGLPAAEVDRIVTDFAAALEAYR